MLYFNELESKKTDCIYSLDMIRLNVDFGHRTEEFFKYFQKLVEYDLECTCDYWMSSKKYSYKHMWDIKARLDNSSDLVSLAIGLDLGRNAEDHNKGFIEFNPNKCLNSSKMTEIITYIKFLAVFIDLVRYDLAIDIPCQRHCAKMYRNRKQIYKYIQGEDGHVTEYLGVRSNNGFCKLYDKTAESHLTYDLTRLEITLDRDTEAIAKFPKICLYDYQLSLELVENDLKPNDRILLSLLRNSDNPQFYFNGLSYHIRKKIEPYLADTVLLLDKKLAFAVKQQALAYEKL